MENLEKIKNFKGTNETKIKNSGKNSTNNLLLNSKLQTPNSNLSHHTSHFSKLTSHRSGITLIALVVTIVILLILAAITINLVLAEGGLFERATQSAEEHEKAVAREELELKLADMQAEKLINNRNYTQGGSDYEYLTTELKEEGYAVDEDGVTVTVKGWKFTIDRSVPKISQSLNEKVDIITSYSQENLLVYLDGEDAPVNNVWKDRSGNENHAIMSGTYTHNANINAYNFTEEEGQGKITKFEYTNGVTISACVELLAYDTINWLFIGNGCNAPTQSRPTLGIWSDTLAMIDTNLDNDATFFQHPTYEETIYTVSITINENGLGKMYLNGELIKEVTFNSSFPNIPTNDFRIRGYGTTTNNDYYTNMTPKCNIYNVLVYDGAITEEEVKNIYEIDKIRYNSEEENLSYDTDKILVYLDGEDAPIDNIWKDRSGNENHAIMSGMYTHDAENSSYNFTTEQGEGLITKFNYTDGITISSCVKLTAQNSSHVYYVGNSYSANTSSRPTLGFNTGLISMFAGTNSGNTTSITSKTNRLYTVTMTINNEGIGKTYIDGTLIATENLGTSFPATPPNDFRIRGYGTTTNTDYWNISLMPVNIYNVLVYNKELSQDEVTHIYKVNKTKLVGSS